MYDQMLGEFYRVIKPGGKLILSTPNILVNSSSGIVTNPYHTQEFTYEELATIIGKYFTRFDIYGQQYSRYENKNKPLAKAVEGLFYQRGVRKLPIKWQDTIMKKLNGIGHYPLSSDFVMVKDKAAILRCKTFFVVAKK